MWSDQPESLITDAVLCVTTSKIKKEIKRKEERRKNTITQDLCGSMRRSNQCYTSIIQELKHTSNFESVR